MSDQRTEGKQGQNSAAYERNEGFSSANGGMGEGLLGDAQTAQALSSHSWKRVRTSDRMAIATATAAAATLAVAGVTSAMAAGLPDGAQVSAGSAGTGGQQIAQFSSSKDVNSFVKVHNVQGRFWFTQNVVTPTSRIIRDLGGTSAVLCDDDSIASPEQAWASRQAQADFDPMEVTLSVSGLVAHPFSQTIGELSKSGSTERLMAYTCADNPADGRATANALVKGIDLDWMLDQAGVRSDANVIKFVSADGYSTRIPLDYVLSHGAVVVHTLNDMPVSRVVGSSNQLWIGATAARYNVRDLRCIVLEKVSEKELPAAPGSAQAHDGYKNRPNVGALYGQTA